MTDSSIPKKFKQKKPSALKTGFRKIFNVLFHKNKKSPNLKEKDIKVQSEVLTVKKLTEISEYGANEEELNEFSTNNSNQSDNREVFLKNHTSNPVFFDSAKKDEIVQKLHNSTPIKPKKYLFSYEKEIAKKRGIETKINAYEIFKENFKNILKFCSLKDCVVLLKSCSKNKVMKRMIKVHIESIFISNPKDEIITQFWDSLIAPSKIIPLNLFQDSLKMPCSEERDINKDLDRTFPEETYFQSNKAKTYLYQVLIAIANTYKEVGYVQGLNYIAGLLLMKYKSACLTFNLISFIFEDLKLIDLMKKSFPMLGLLNYQLDLFLKFYMFDIYSHLKVNGLELDFFSTKWFMTLFSMHFNKRITLHIWNLLFIYDLKILIKSVLALFFIHKEQILSNSNDELYQYIQEMDIPEDHENLYFTSLSKFKIRNKTLTQIAKIFTENEGNPAKLSALSLKIVKDQSFNKLNLQIKKEPPKIIENDKKSVVGLIDDIKSTIDNIFNSRMRSYSINPKQPARNKANNEMEYLSYNSLHTEVLKEEEEIKEVPLRNQHFSSYRSDL